MIGFFNRLANTWPARLGFLLFAVAFVGWGVGDMLRGSRDPGATFISVDGQEIDRAEFDRRFRAAFELYRRRLAAADGGDVEAGARYLAATRVEQQLMAQALTTAANRQLGLVVSDEALRRDIYTDPRFLDSSGRFDRMRFDNALAGSGLDSSRYMAQLRDDLRQGQLLHALTAGGTASRTLTSASYRVEHEVRTVQSVALPVAAATPPAPSDADLHRFYDNNPTLFTRPEYRQVVLAVLSPETMAATLPVTDDELRGFYEQRKDQLGRPERRTAQAISIDGEAMAKALAEQWRGGASWAAIQDAATAAGAHALTLDGYSRSQAPTAELGEAMFSAKQDEVVGPLRDALGWHLLRVTAIQPPGLASFDEVKDALRRQYALGKANETIDARQKAVQDELASGADLDKLAPEDGVTTLALTLDRDGNGPDGKSAAIPGAATLRAAVLKTAFEAAQGNQPTLIEAPNAPGTPVAFYAVRVNGVTPSARIAFDEARPAVVAAWTRDAQHHAQDEAATKLLAAIKGGETLADAAAKSGLTVGTLPPLSRATASPDVPDELRSKLLKLNRNEATMAEDANGFVVAQVTDIRVPDPAGDPAAQAQLRDALSQGIGLDIATSYMRGLQTRLKPKVNQRMLDAAMQSDS